MSISNFQEKVIKGGCGKAILLLSVVALGFTMTFSSCGKGQRLNAVGIDGKPETPLVTVGEASFPISFLDEIVAEQEKSMNPEILRSLPPEYRLSVAGGALTQLVQSGHMYEYALKNGFKNDDDFVLQASHLKSDAEFKSYAKESLTKAGMLKANATEAEFDALIKQQAGTDFPTLYKTQKESIEKALKDPQKRMVAVLQIAQRHVMENVQKGIKATEDQVKKSYEFVQVKRVWVKADEKISDADAKAKADKAYADLKAGKSFESVMEAYSDEPAEPGKKKGDNMMKLDASMLEGVPDYAIVNKLQPGSYSEPVKVTGGYAVYKYTGKISDVPKDFDKKKADYIAQYEVMESQRILQKELEKLGKEIEPKFHIPAYEALYLFQKAQMEKAGTAQTDAFKKAYEAAKGVNLEEARGSVAAIVQLAAFQRLYDAPGADKAKMKPEYLASIEKFLKNEDNWAYRKELIDGYKEAKDGTKATEQILVAMDKNIKYDQTGQSTFSDINAKFIELKQAGLVTPEQEKEFREKQDLWRSEKKATDDQAAEYKKQMDEEKKKADAAAKAEKAKNPPTQTPKK